MIFYNGRSSDDFHVIVEKYPQRPVPQRKAERFQVQGRSGDVYVEQDAWENVTRVYDVYISAEGPQLPIVAAKAIEWLMAPGYHELCDDYDADTFTMAHVLGPIDIQNIQNAFGRLSIEFDCWPQRFYRSGSYASEMAQDGVLVNPSIYPAQPLIVLTGAGSGALTIGNSTLTLADCNGVTVDCRNMEVYRGTENLNAGVSGDFPVLGAGRTSVSWTGGITAVKITPRWYVL